MEHATPARVRRIDILRGIAVFGILLVNVWNFIFVGNYRYGVLPDNAGWLDQMAVFAIAAFAEFKFYPLFAFLFGAGFILQTDRLRAEPGGLPEAKRIYRRRLAWLLGCGLLLGMLLFRGEILTAYALVGYWMLHVAAGKRTGDLVRILRRTAAAAIVFGLLLVLGTWLSKPSSPQQASVKVAEMVRQSDLFINGSWPVIVRERLVLYLRDLVLMVLMFPHIAACFMLGAVATRLGWLTRPGRYRAGWRRVRMVGLLIGLPANAALAWLMLQHTLHPLRPSVAEMMVFPVLFFAGPVLTAAYVAHLMLFGPQRVIRWSKWLAPVGRMAMTNYVTQALLLVLILQGTGLGLAKHLSHAGVVGVCLVLMAVQLVWSRRWLLRHRHGPLETVWRRFTYR